MFENLQSLFLILGISIAFLTIVAVALLFGLSFRSNRIYDTQIKDASNSVRIITIDLNSGMVTYFNRSDLNKKRVVPLLTYYEHFPVEEREDFISWINDLIDEDADVAKYKEIHVIVKHRKTNLYSFLEVKDINYKDKIIRLDSYLLKNSYVKKAKKDDVKQLSNQETFNNLLLSSSSSKGFTAQFDFYNIRNSEEISHLAFLQIKNVFKNYVLPHRPIIELASHQLVISDLKVANRLQFIQLVNTIKNDVNALLMLQSLQDQIAFTVAAIENKFMANEPEKLVNTLTSLNQIARDDNESFIWYEEGRDFEAEHGEETYRTEVEHIIHDKKLRFLFRPIVDLGKARIIGYQSFAEPVDTFFSSIRELKSYASRTEDDRILFATIARNTITRFAQEKSVDSHRLFLPVNNFERHYVNRTFAHVSGIKNVHIVLVYDEEELTNITDDSVIIAEIRNFKSRGYQVALELNDNDLTLTGPLYETFDYFLVDVVTNLKIGNKGMQRSLYNFRALVEKLLKYRRPIIAVGVPSWDSVELIDSLGIDYVSSDAIAQPSENVLPLSTKSLTKLKNLSK